MRNTIDPKCYDLEKGSDWPTWEDFLKGKYTKNKNVNNELDSFVSSYAYTLKLDEKDFNIDNHIFNVFPPLVYRFQFPFDYKTLEPLVEAKLNSLVQNSPNTDGDMIVMSLNTGLFDQSTDMPHCWPEFCPFVRFVHQIIEQVKKRNLIRGSHSIPRSWLNKGTKGGSLTEHSHVPATFSLVTYLKATTGTGKLVFRDPLEYHKGNYGFPSYYPEHFLRREIEVSTNDVLVFPGFMHHYTTPHNSDDDRISFSLDVQCDFPDYHEIESYLGKINS